MSATEPSRPAREILDVQEARCRIVGGGPAGLVLATVIIQTVQAQIQKRLLGAALDASRPFRPPAFLRPPFLRNLMVHRIAFGPGRVRVDLADSKGFDPA